MKDVSVDCPNYAFSLDRSISFVIGSFVYETSRQVLQEKVFNPFDNLRISALVNPNAGEENFALLSDIQEILHSFEEPDWIEVRRPDAWMVASLFLVLCLCAAIGFLFWVVLRKSREQEDEYGHVGVEIQVIPNAPHPLIIGQHAYDHD